MMKAIVHTKLILEDGIVWDGALTYDGARIIECGKADEVKIPDDAEILDAKGLYTAPGLIDIHNHGGPDNKFADDPIACLRHVLKHGVTTVLPTFYCDMTIPEMIAGAKKLQAVQSEYEYGGMIGGLYMEGPYMGGFGSNQKDILHGGKIDRKDYAGLIEQTVGFARVWAIDPMREGIDGFMRDVKEIDGGAIFAMGHSHATAEDCRRVRKYGLKLQTHHGDSGKAQGRAQGTVGAGCDEYTLYDPDIYAELIADENGIHVDPDMMRMVIRTKGVERVILISDSMPDLHHYKNNEAEGILYGPDLNYDYEGHLAGSHLTLDHACRNVMAHTGCGICQAVRMASLNPAKLLGIDDRYGSIEPGKAANLILTDDMMNVRTVIFEGIVLSEKIRDK
ncbi:MAG: N-acetylglucosamine-6-phosphate deacetylase [Clostridia bacterium]|nr:N-acetylglucosamine-6-phosphate deacetylase [Clostridia bacterium]